MKCETDKKDFLPVTMEDLKARGWEYVDFICVTGDAYVDHSSFGITLIARLLKKLGYRVGIIAQPRWDTGDDIRKLGTPRLGFLVTSGNIDSMVAAYTAAKKRRHNDDYSPGGHGGKRPTRALMVYCGLIRRYFSFVPIIVGGLEASLRRFAHYDYWDDKVRRSILFDCAADLLVYGMGEKAITEAAAMLRSGKKAAELRGIEGTAYITEDISQTEGITIASYEQVQEDKKQYAKAIAAQYQENDPILGKRVIQPCEGRFLVQEKPAMPLSGPEMDGVYALDYMYDYHPMYQEMGGVPAIEEVKFSLLSCRGCFGGCNFCSLAFHQGRIVQGRSHEAIVKEAMLIKALPDFKGYIHDVGGPTANFRQSACKKQLTAGSCADRQCLFPEPCKNLIISHSDYSVLLDKLKSIQGIKKVFIRSGVRFDYLMADRGTGFLEQMCRHHISGQLKVAPEHISDHVLYYMGKPGHSVYQTFSDRYKKANQKAGKKQYLVPYFISSHPGSTLADAVELAVYFKKEGVRPLQVQDFYPTPGTLSTCMYYTGIDPRTMKKVYVATDPAEKAMQRALLQFSLPANYHLVHKALVKAGRGDLIGYGRECLIKPMGGKQNELQNNRRKGSFRKDQGRGKGSGAKS